MSASQRPQPAAPLHAGQPASTSPAVSISPQCHLDPACYVKGTYLLSIEANAVLHPRCRLYTDRGPVTIGSGSILNERCILGLDKEMNPPSTNIPTRLEEEAAKLKELAITIGPRASLQSTVKLQPPCTIGEAVILEAGVTILPMCTVGAHSKVCAGVTLPPGTIIPEWTVVYGQHGQMRRKRQADIAEDSRMDGMSRERHGLENLLKMSTAKALSSAGASSKSKRESVIRTDSPKG